MRSTASRICGPQSHRWLPKTSPVRHSLCGRTSGGRPRCALRGERSGTVAQAEGEVLAAVHQPVEGEHARGRGVAVGEPQRHHQLGTDRSRQAALPAFGPPLVSPSESRRERVPQQHHVTDPAHLRERRPPVRVPREPAVADEPPGPRVADEERRHDQVQLVGEVGGQELGVHRPAALDHQPLDAPGVEVLAEPPHVHRLAAVDHGRHRPEPRPGLGHRRARAVDQLLGVAGGEEVRARVQLRPAGHGHLHRRGPKPTGQPAPPVAPASAPAAAGCRSGRWPRPPGSRRRRRARRRRGRGRPRWRAAAASRRHCRGSRRSTCRSSAGCRDAQPRPRLPGPPPAARPDGECLLR